MLLLTPSAFEPEVILLAVGWYLRFSLSYRDVEELVAERGLSVDHVTVWRWVQRPLKFSADCSTVRLQSCSTSVFRTFVGI
jgi:transposase-like protein